MTAQLMRETLDWQVDMPWRFIRCPLGFEQVDAALELEPSRYFPARRGRFPRAPAGAHMLRLRRSHARGCALCDPGPGPLSMPRLLDRPATSPAGESSTRCFPQRAAVIQLVVAERTGAAHYAEGFAGRQRWRPSKTGAVDWKRPALTLGDSGVLLLNSSLTLTRQRATSGARAPASVASASGPGSQESRRGTSRSSLSASATRRPRRSMMRVWADRMRPSTGRVSSARIR